MSKLYHDDDAGLADFTAGLRKAFEDLEWMTGTFAIVGLTNYGERPVQSTRLAEVLGQSVSEAEALAERSGMPGTRVEDGHITVDPGRAKAAARRQIWIGDRQLGVTGCAPDVLLYAPLVRPSLRLEETCTITGTPIRIEFTPNTVEHVEPTGTVVPIFPPQEAAGLLQMDIEDIDANI
jgi:hypothetical protein